MDTNNEMLEMNATDVIGFAEADDVEFELVDVLNALFCLEEVDQFQYQTMVDALEQAVSKEDNNLLKEFYNTLVQYNHVLYPMQKAVMNIISTESDEVQDYAVATPDLNEAMANLDENIEYDLIIIYNSQKESAPAVDLSKFASILLKLDTNYKEDFLKFLEDKQIAIVHADETTIAGKLDFLEA